MRKYTPHYGPEVDLDDPVTYSGLPQDKWEVIKSIYTQIGYCKVYFVANDWVDQKQVEWVDKFVHDIAKDFSIVLHARDLIWWQEKLWMLLDETENLC